MLPMTNTTAPCPFTHLVGPCATHRRVPRPARRASCPQKSAVRCRSGWPRFLMLVVRAWSAGPLAGRCGSSPPSGTISCSHWRMVDKGRRTDRSTLNDALTVDELKETRIAHTSPTTRGRPSLAEDSSLHLSTSSILKGPPVSESRNSTSRSAKIPFILPVYRLVFRREKGGTKNE